MERRTVALADLMLLLAAPCVGSFVGLLADRLPAGRPVLWDRSACDHCGTRLAARDLIPIASWLFGRGRCRFCRGRLSLAYPLVETAALGIAIWSLAVVPPGPALTGCILGWTLLVLALIDQKHLRLPDVLTLPLIPLGLLATGWLAPERLPDHLIGALAGYGLLWVTARAYSALRRREGLGLGDAKLLAAGGAWVGWTGLPGILLIAATGALACTLLLRAGRGMPARDEVIPFGPWLAAGIWLTWLYGPLSIA